MPELPEVETIASGLKDRIQNKTVLGMAIRNSAPLRNINPDIYARFIKKRKITDCYRRGKYIVLELSGKYFLVFHLRMTGNLLWERIERPPAKHTHFILRFGGNRELRFVDPRRFGSISFVKDINDFFLSRDLGPEPLSRDFNFQTFKNLLRGRETGIKQLLLDQKRVSGLGNIYVSEALFHAGIRPTREAGSLKDKEIKKLLGEIKKLLRRAIIHRGTSISDYVDSRGEKGGFAGFLCVYGRDKVFCPRCRGKIKTVRLGGRSSNFCPACQK